MSILYKFLNFVVFVKNNSFINFLRPKYVLREIVNATDGDLDPIVI